MTPNNEAHVPWVHEYMGINLWLGLEIGRFRSILPQTTKKKYNKWRLFPS